MTRNFEEWLGTFRKSISDYKYYVDFEKIYANVEGCKIELNILNSLIGSKDIEAEFKICRSTVTNILKLMEKKGYIKRESVPYDARLKKLVLTDTGRELHEKTKDMIDMLEEQTVAGISKEDLDTFYRVIDQVKNNVKNMLGETSC